MTNAKERLEEIEEIIKNLKQQLEKTEEEKCRLLKEIYGSDHEAIDAMPARVRNALEFSGIATDMDLQHFLDGEFKKEPNTRMCFAQVSYATAKTRKGRLMCIRNIGEKTATEALRIAEEKGV